MASNVHIKTTTRNSMLDLLNTAIGSGGFLRIYDGTQPTNADTALGSQVKLAELALSSSPFQAAASGAVSINTITDDTDADATGTATWASFVTSGGTRILDVAVGTSGADVNLNTTAIQIHATVSVTSYTLTFAA